LQGKFSWPGLAVQVPCWVHRGIFDVYLVMEMWSCSLAGQSHRADDLPAFEDLADDDEYPA